MTQIPNQNQHSFYGLGIAPKMLEAIERMKFTAPTPIQHKAIPVGIEGKDIIGIAQTGTGKTLAFAVPIIQRLSQSRGRALILVPTRELAIQVNETFKKLSPSFGIKSVVIIGGASMNEQVRELRKNPRVIIATPGRLADHMARGAVLLWDVSVLVLDEADRMLDMGFLPQIEHIIKFISKGRQTMLFSATIPEEIVRIASAHMRLPVHVEVAPSGTMAEGIMQELFIVRRDKKLKLLAKMLQRHRGTMLLFSRTKRGARKITRFIRGMGYPAAEIHSDRSLTQRREALEGFKTGRYRILVATDIASRGIDVIGIEVVLNYDLPEDAQNYVHRIGRTGRAGREGLAISFATPEQGDDVRNIEKLIKAPLSLSEHPGFPKGRFIRRPGTKYTSRPHYRKKRGHSRRYRPSK